MYYVTEQTKAKHKTIMLLLLFVSVHPQTLLAFMGSYFMSFSFFTTRHVGSRFFNVSL